MIRTRATWVVLLALTGATGWAQVVDSTITLNFLRNPVSPAANIIGIAPNEIQRPTDVTGFIASLQNATGGFSALPANFAVDIAPYWLFGNRGRNLTFGEEKSPTKGSIPQTFVFSAAFRSLKSRRNTDSTSQLALGVKFSIVRGRYDSQELDEVKAFLREANTLRATLTESLRDNNADYKNVTDQIRRVKAKRNKTLSDSLSIQQLENERLQLLTQLEAEVAAQYAQRISKYNRNVLRLANEPLQRYGFKLDFAAGLAWDYPNNQYSAGNLYRTGAWLTGGIDSKQGHVFLGIIRYLYNPEVVFADPQAKLNPVNAQTLDGGIRYNYQEKTSPVSVGAEFIYRSVLNTGLINDSWRLVANFNYEVATNTVLTFAIGRDFDRTVKKDGNIIGVLNLIKGFGSSRRILGE
ncbi:hypothetical protein HNV11_17680 [Spirosoma taeanense]|uniref:Uncharacterized protein n=1 Tax=Spirosoma taeanense TaxID=2735870 RepID=A0A6M5YAR6_9BACT|nr:hypothetical protein [Spirosoma taeanense]QJW91075.1 hypothetical protein HNV11_17680 [Spirosoma taeanense]